MINYSQVYMTEEFIYSRETVSQVELAEDNIFYDMKRMLDNIVEEREKHDGTLTKEDLDVIVRRLNWAIDSHWLCKEKKHRLRFRGSLKERLNALRYRLARWIEP